MATHPDTNLDFSAPPEIHHFDGLLFDCDGTLVDSTDAIIQHWKQIGDEIGVDHNVILQTSHGRRSIDVLAQLAPERATWAYVRATEATIPARHGATAGAIPGARALLASLDARAAPWGIVTSGTRPLVEGWLEVLGLPAPRVVVSAEEVVVGKPDPEGYLVGWGRLVGGGSSGERERVRGLVLEDAPAGVRAGKAAGLRVVAVVTTHDGRELRDAGADWVVRDLRSLRVVEGGEGVGIEISDAWVG